MRDFTEEAAALFARFAERYGLQSESDASAPVEVLWRFPQQARLAHPIVLALQNGDELNFGVGEFWSYFFPFDQKVEEFETIINSWVDGNARVTQTSPWAYTLQVKDERGWTDAYSAGQVFPKLRRRPTLTNEWEGLGI